MVFKKAERGSVIIEKSKIDESKINIEVKNKTLHIYLDDAKTVTKTEKVTINSVVQNRPIYKGTMLSLIINYKELQEASLRGEESITFQNAIDNPELDLKIYGESRVVVNKIIAKKLKIAIYGESFLKIKDGNVDYQRYRCYGESEINALKLNTEKTKIAVYGSSHIAINCNEELKISAFGEASIQYTGDATLKNGLKIGETVIQKIN